MKADARLLQGNVDQMRGRCQEIGSFYPLTFILVQTPAHARGGVSGGLSKPSGEISLDVGLSGSYYPPTLAHLAGCDAEALWRVSIRNLGRNALRLRHEMATTHTLLRSRIRICPRCIQEDAGPTWDVWHLPRRVTWQFCSIRSCPTHKCALIALPAEQFTLHSYDFTAQIRKHRRLIERAVPIPQKHTAFEDYLWRRIAGERGEAWIDRLELNVASRACEVFGLLRAHGPDSKLSGHALHSGGQTVEGALRRGRTGDDLDGDA